MAYDYWISKYEVTNAQYAELLNAKAASDPLGLYNTIMDGDATFGGITQSGVSGSYTYSGEGRLRGQAGDLCVVLRLAALLRTG